MNEKLTTLLQQGKYKEIESKLANRKRSSQERVIYAVSLSSQGKSDAAEKEYLALLIAEPKNFDALNNLGNVYLKREDNKAALKYFKLAADAGHSDATHLARALVNMSVAARELGDQVTELNALENAVEVAPQMSLALRALAVRYLTEKRCEEAIGLLLRAVCSEPRDVEAWANLSAGYTRDKKYEKVEKVTKE
jgi:Tfp pilus assembly protein PilF